MAKKRIIDFLGKPEKARRNQNMATANKLNVYQKLIKARTEFLNSYVEQTGKNMNLSFKYFELKDIVPTVTKIFNDIGLVAIVNFTDTVASLNIVNTDTPEETIEFLAPFNQIQPIISNSGKQVTNDMQALGSSITYMRRYLYLISMDICVNDEIEPIISNNDTAKSKAPATPAQRAEVKEELTSPNDNATPLQIRGLKKVLKDLKDKDSSKEEMIAKIAIETKGFTEISKSDCEKLIEKITAMLEETE